MSRRIWRRVVDFVVGDLPKETRPKLSAAAAAFCSEDRLRLRVDELLKANGELVAKNRELEAEARIGRAFKAALKAAEDEAPVRFDPGFRPDPAVLGVAG